MDSAGDLLLPAARAPGGAKPGVSAETIFRATRLVFGILAACGAALALAALWSVEYPALLGHAFVAFALGLRHAVDSDHIAAIDNVTRQLLLTGQRPVSVGFWFAIGHSTVMLLLTSALAGVYSWASAAWSRHGSSAGPAAGIVSVVLLGGIALLNAYVSLGLYADWRRLRALSGVAREVQANEAREDALRTALSVIPFVRRSLDRVNKPFKMYGVGFLFGLSFDSAIQVGLIGLAAMSGTHGLAPPAYIMIFPVAFCCGMCLVDTITGLLMVSACTWTVAQPTQTLLYNFLITLMSASIALVICSLELLQIVAQEAGLHGAFWAVVQNVDMAVIGYAVIVSFVLVLLAATVGSGRPCRPCASKARQPSSMECAPV